jgi:hypothetical protein
VNRGMSPWSSSILPTRRSGAERSRTIPLVDLCLPADGSALPGDVRALLREADRRIEQLWKRRRVPGFIPSDFVRVYRVLRAVAEGDVAPGQVFCEWGSGLGVVACLAAMLDFDARGIEIEEELVDAARRLADDFGLSVEFLHGSFIPAGSEDCLDGTGGFAWLTPHCAGIPEEPGVDPADVDVVFAYPWPDEEQVIAALFERHAGTGAVLVTYHGHDDLRLRRKVGRKSEAGDHDPNA